MEKARHQQRKKEALAMKKSMTEKGGKPVSTQTAMKEADSLRRRRAFRNKLGAAFKKGGVTEVLKLKGKQPKGMASGGTVRFGGAQPARAVAPKRGSIGKRSISAQLGKSMAKLGAASKVGKSHPPALMAKGGVVKRASSSRSGSRGKASGRRR
jgi:hypothetical protein